MHRGSPHTNADMANSDAREHLHHFPAIHYFQPFHPSSLHFTLPALSATPMASPSPDSPSPSPYTYPGKRKRSSSPIPSARRRPKHNSSEEEDDDDSERSRRIRSDLTVEVCKNFTRSTCGRSQIDCKFAHPHSSVQIVGDKVTACADSLRNKCYRGRTCRYYHPPPHIQESLLKAAGMQDVKVEPVCKDFLRGRCSRGSKECRFAHHAPIDHHVIVCQDFLRGNCERKACRYSHVSDYRTSQRQGTPVKLPSSEPQTRNDQEILPVCMDFLKKKCSRDICKYAHPEEGTEVIDKQVVVCRDFRRGVCRRTACRFYHPPVASDVRRKSVHDSRPLL